MPKPKVNIYCPVETINRELDFRLFFAAHCARPDIRFIIGRHFTLYELLKNMNGGLYIGQNIRPRGTTKPKAHQTAQVETLRARGTTLMALDEEGGVMAGDEGRWKKWLDVRLQVKQMQSHEHVCTWGDFQRDYYKSQDPSCRENIVTTGHPRFDLYKPSHSKYYDDESARWKEKYGDFILVNTNFAWSNHARGEKFVFAPNWSMGPRNESKAISHVREWAHKNHVWSNMVALVTRISIEMPELNIIVRPHPSENMKFYQTVFDELPNVHVEHEGSVGPWLLASRALIHDGCTTALEAHFCGIPILNYKSVENTTYDLELPNAFGLRCESEDQLLESLQQILSGDKNIGRSEEVPAVAKSLIHNFGHDSFAALTTIVHGVVEKLAPASPEDDAVLRQHQRSERYSEMVRRAKSRFRPRDKEMLDRFYGFENANLEARFEKVKEVMNTDLNFEILSDRIVVVES